MQQHKQLPRWRYKGNKDFQGVQVALPDICNAIRPYLKLSLKRNNAKFDIEFCQHPSFFYYFGIKNGDISIMSENCLFCKIIKGEIPSKKIYEDDDVFAFYDIAPQAPVHFLVVPKRHIATIMDMKQEDCELVGKMLYRAQLIAKDLGLEEGGARVVFNCKADAGQTVFHIHLHVVGGQEMGWPPFPAK